MSNYYPDPEKELIKKTMRRGGPMDTMKVRLVCQQCAETVTLSFRQIHAGKKPACSTCGPDVTFVRQKDVTQDGD